MLQATNKCKEGGKQRYCFPPPLHLLVAYNVVFLVPYIYWWPVTLFSSSLTFIGKQRYRPPINVREEEKNVTGHQ
jgi:hypothetical protein